MESVLPALLNREHCEDPNQSAYAVSASCKTSSGSGSSLWTSALHTASKLSCRVEGIQKKRAEKRGDDGNSYRSGDFLQLGTGGAMLDLTKTRSYSSTLSNSQAISDELIKLYLDRWKGQGWPRSPIRRTSA